MTDVNTGCSCQSCFKEVVVANEPLCVIAITLEGTLGWAREYMSRCKIILQNQRRRSSSVSRSLSSVLYHSNDYSVRPSRFLCYLESGIASVVVGLNWISLSSRNAMNLFTLINKHITLPRFKIWHFIATRYKTHKQKINTNLPAHTGGQTQEVGNPKNDACTVQWKPSTMSVVKKPACHTNEIQRIMESSSISHA